jgi:hypothetical protein
MATVKVIFHGSQVPNGEPLMFTQVNAIGTREEISTKMAEAVACSSTIVFSGDNYTTIINKNHVAMIEVSD